MPLFACTTPRYGPRCWRDVVGLADRQLFRLHQLPEAARTVLLSLDGASDFESYAFTPRHRAILRELIRQGYAKKYPDQVELSAFQRPRRADSPYLREVHWSITGRCNLRCRHCFMASPEDRYPEPSFNVLEKMVVQFVQANVAFVSLTGGEPLIHPDFDRLMALLHEVGIPVSQIATNGMLVNAPFMAMLDDVEQKPVFQLSLDGVGKHDQMRGISGAETAALDAIALCVAKQYITSVTSIFNRDNIQALLPTYERLKVLGVSMWIVNQAQTTGMWQGGQANLTADEMGEALLTLQQRWLEEGKPLRMLLASYFDAKPDDEMNQHAAMRYTADSLECPETRERIFLLPDGRLLPCPGYTGTAIADEMPSLLDHSLVDILEDSSLSRFCRDRKSIRLDKNPQCQGCDHFSECGMGCRAYALTENGSIDAPDPRVCNMYKQGWKKRFSQKERWFSAKEVLDE
jgi:radical SAM protein with 4Fe4S-binding SPASM domain